MRQPNTPRNHPAIASSGTTATAMSISGAGSLPSSFGFLNFMSSLRWPTAGASIQWPLPITQQSFGDIYVPSRIGMRRVVGRLFFNGRHRVVGAAAGVAAIGMHVVCYWCLPFWGLNDRQPLSFREHEYPKLHADGVKPTSDTARPKPNFGAHAGTDDLGTHCQGLRVSCQRRDLVAATELADAQHLYDAFAVMKDVGQRLLAPVASCERKAVKTGRWPL